MDSTESQPARERLISLNGAHVWVQIVRAHSGAGAAVVCEGTLQLRQRPDVILSFSDDEVGRLRFADIIDEEGLPIVVLLSSEALWLFNDILRAERRVSFHVDVVASPPTGIDDPTSVIAYSAFLRELTAEIEGGLHEGLLVDPDPDPSANWRALYPKLFPLEPKHFEDRTPVQFSTNLKHAFIRPRGSTAVSVEFLGVVIGPSGPVFARFEERRGSTYQLTTADRARLAMDIRAFFNDRRERFVQRSASL